jgi:hypothetical protein
MTESRGVVPMMPLSACCCVPGNAQRVKAVELRPQPTWLCWYLSWGRESIVK